jgi:hypothetical protein
VELQKPSCVPLIQLQDHPDVVNRPPLRIGLGTMKLFFFTHEYPEYKDDQFSNFNDREAEFIAGLYHYLLQIAQILGESLFLHFTMANESGS